jgi:hypothetical protein
LASSGAFADCATSGSGPVTPTCSGTFATTNTQNSVSQNPDITDRIQAFSDSVNASGASGAVIGGAGLAPTSTLSGSTVASFEGEFSNLTRSCAGKGVVRYSW